MDSMIPPSSLSPQQHPFPFLPSGTQVIPLSSPQKPQDQDHQQRFLLSFPSPPMSLFTLRDQLSKAAEREGCELSVFRTVDKEGKRVEVGFCASRKVEVSRFSPPSSPSSSSSSSEYSIDEHLLFSPPPAALPRPLPLTHNNLNLGLNLNLNQEEDEEEACHTPSLSFSLSSSPLYTSAGPSTPTDLGSPFQPKLTLTRKGGKRLLLGSGTMGTTEGVNELRRRLELLQFEQKQREWQQRERQQNRMGAPPALLRRGKGLDPRAGEYRPTMTHQGLFNSFPTANFRQYPPPPPPPPPIQPQQPQQQQQRRYIPSLSSFTPPPFTSPQPAPPPSHEREKKKAEELAKTGRGSPLLERIRKEIETRAALSSEGQDQEKEYRFPSATTNSPSSFGASSTRLRPASETSTLLTLAEELDDANKKKTTTILSQKQEGVRLLEGFGQLKEEGEVITVTASGGGGDREERKSQFVLPPSFSAGAGVGVGVGGSKAGKRAALSSFATNKASSSSPAQQQQQVIPALGLLSSIENLPSSSSSFNGGGNGKGKQVKQQQQQQQWGIWRNDPTSAEQLVDLSKIERGEEKRTTLMIRNIPNRCSAEELLGIIEEVCPRSIDAFYLRIDFKTGLAVGFATVNFLTSEAMLLFLKERLGTRWNMHGSDKILLASWAEIQGKRAFIDKFRNSAVMEERPAYRPRIFYSSGPAKGLPEPFPESDNHARRERSRANKLKVGLFPSATAPSSSGAAGGGGIAAMGGGGGKPSFLVARARTAGGGGGGGAGGQGGGLRA